MTSAFQPNTFTFGAFDLLLVVEPESLNFAQTGLFGSAGQSEVDMNAFQSNAFQSYVFQTIPNLLKTDPEWSIKAKKRKWTVFA
jgi:hypothetical protein